MSFVISVLYQDKIVMASDGKVTSSKGETVKSDYKKIKKFKKFIIGYAGDREYCEYILKQIGYDFPIETTCELINKIIMRIDPSNKAKFIIAGKNKFNKKIMATIDSESLNNSQTILSNADLQYSFCSSPYLNGSDANEIIINNICTNMNLGIENVLGLIIKEISKLDPSVNDTIFVEKF